MGAALDRGGLAIGATGRARLSPRWGLGLSLEFSPWFDLLSAGLSPGVANGYATASVRWLATERVELRSAAHLGTSVLLFEPVGARRGSVGVFVGLALLSVSISFGDYSLELTPDVSLSVPSLSGVPLLYRQYRLMVSLVRWL